MCQRQSCAHARGSNFLRKGLRTLWFKADLAHIQADRILACQWAVRGRTRAGHAGLLVHQLQVCGLEADVLSTHNQQPVDNPCPHPAAEPCKGVKVCSLLYMAMSAGLCCFAVVALALLAFTRLSWGVSPEQLLHSKQLGCVDLVGDSLLHSCQCGRLTILQQNWTKRPNFCQQHKACIRPRNSCTCGSVLCMSSTVTPWRTMVSGRCQVGKLMSRKRTVRLDIVKYRLSTLQSTLFATVARSSLMPAIHVNGCNTDKQAVMLGKRTLLLCQL